jgi:hypothetical protein
MNLKYNMFLNIEYVMLIPRLIYLTYLQKLENIVQICVLKIEM